MNNKTPRMPLQPIRDGRFVPNKIVQHLLDVAPINLNDLARMGFSNNDWTQFAQLIGYSLSGFGGLSYVDDEAYDAAQKMAEGMTEEEARNEALRIRLDAAKKGVRDAAVALFTIHPDTFGIEDDDE